MIGFARGFRLVPVVVVATASLFALKTVGLLTDGGFTLGKPRLAHKAELKGRPEGMPSALAASDAPPIVTSAAPKVLSYLAEDGLGYPDYTGNIGAAKAADAKGPAGAVGDKSAKTEKVDKASPPPTDKLKDVAPPNGIVDHPVGSPGERAVLESLNQRRQELEARARDLDTRESLMAAAERRLEARLGELKEMEARINVTSHKRDENETAQFKGLVTMYENMKPKDAARIFDRLDLKILVDLVGQMNPRKVSDIMAQMLPEAAERLTTEIARRSGSGVSEPPAGELPKIEGRPNGN